MSLLHEAVDTVIENDNHTFINEVKLIKVPLQSGAEKIYYCSFTRGGSHH